MMTKVFIFSDLYLCTFPFVEFQLYHELKNRGLDVRYVVLNNDIRMSINDIWEKYEKLNLIVVNKLKDLVSVSSENDIFIIRFCYKGLGGKAAQMIKNNKRILFQYDVGGVDIAFRTSPANFLMAKSEHLKKRAAKNFPNAYKNIFVTGTLQYDSVYTTEVNRDEFIRSYGLDAKKKFIILTPANPGEAWMPGLKDTYRKIADVVNRRCPNYQLAVKGHPLDYMANMDDGPGVIKKGQHYNNRQSWNELFPNITVIKADEGYKALKACDVVLNIRSSLAMEVPLFRKPLININRKDFATHWPFDPKVMMDIRMKELATTLNENKYDISKIACKDYAIRENYADDGKAYVRVADTVIKIMEQK